MTNLIALAVPGFFVLILIELFIARLMGRKDLYRFNDAITDIGCGIGQQVTGILIKAALLGGYFYIYNHFALWQLSASSPLGWSIAFIVVEVGYYWWHRLSHEVNFLWAIHVVHHQSEDYNLAVALRQAWFSPLTIWPFMIIAVFLGVHPITLVLMGAISTLYQFWIHTRTIQKLGLLEWIINTPSHHRVHHGRDYEYLDKNYGGILIIWDRLFGSFKEEAQEPMYGTVKIYESWNPVWANFAYWMDLARDARQATHWSDKIKIWFKFPGWLPKGVTRVPRPNPPTSRIRYNTKTPKGLNFYIAVQFILVTIVSTLLMDNHFDSIWVAPAIIALILVTTLFWGGIFERKSWAFSGELARLVLIAGITGILFMQKMMPVTYAAISGSLLIIFAVWLLQYRNLFFSTQEPTVTYPMEAAEKN